MMCFPLHLYHLMFSPGVGDGLGCIPPNSYAEVLLPKMTERACIWRWLFIEGIKVN